MQEAKPGENGPNLYDVGYDQCTKPFISNIYLIIFFGYWNTDNVKFECDLYFISDCHWVGLFPALSCNHWLTRSTIFWASAKSKFNPVLGRNFDEVHPTVSEKRS